MRHSPAFRNPHQRFGRGPWFTVLAALLIGETAALLVLFAAFTWLGP